MNSQELNEYYQKCAAVNKKVNSALKIYCICMDGNVNNQEIESAANTLGITVIKINFNDLFIMPNAGRCGFNDQERYLNSIGVTVRDALTLICQNIQNKLMSENSAINRC